MYVHISTVKELTVSPILRIWVYVFCAFLSDGYNSSSPIDYLHNAFLIHGKTRILYQMRVLPVRHQHKPLCIIT